MPKIRSTTSCTRRSLPNKYPQPDPARPRLLQRLHLPQPHQSAELLALINDGLGIGCASLARLRDYIEGKLL